MRADAELEFPLPTWEETFATAARADVPSIYANTNVFRALLVHPRLAQAVYLLTDTLTFDSDLDDRLRELAVLRIAYVTTSRYELEKHRLMAVESGVLAEEVEAVANWQECRSFSPADQAILAATDDVLSTGMVSSTSWKHVREHVSPDPQTLLDLVAVIGTWRLLSEILRSIGIPLEEDATQSDL